MKRQCCYQSLDFENFYAPKIASRTSKHSFNQIRDPAKVLHPGLLPGKNPAQRGKHAPLYGHASVGKVVRKLRKRKGEEREMRGGVEEDSVSLSGEWSKLKNSD